MKRTAFRIVVSIMAVVGLSFSALSEVQTGLQLDLSGIVSKTNEVEFQSYLRAIGIKTRGDDSAVDEACFMERGLEDVAWIMWEKDIDFPTNDLEHAVWRLPAIISIDSARFAVLPLGASQFEILSEGCPMASCEVHVFNTCKEQMESFMRPRALQIIKSTALIKFSIMERLEVSHLGAKADVLYISERGSLEDSVTYRNITLKIRYKDDSLSNRRKAIAEALMKAGAVTKSGAASVPNESPGTK